jgi:putative transposase
MWTEGQRRIYRREGEGCPSDLPDVEWARLEPMIPPARPGGRPRKTDMRAAMNAIRLGRQKGLPMRVTPPPFKIATGPVWCSTRSADVSRGSN